MNGSADKKLTICYFAGFREHAGVGQESGDHCCFNDSGCFCSNAAPARLI